ncbi:MULTISPECIES: 4-alpha-glucanotransferase [unclassified Vibrio]|uniref:4-alpha-glucanotransferase n=1 Tax=Vibrio sp. HB236076 TaxID=3232307 RepID=A0AB39HK54_9VIBR|nr:4-alpha-glucanotransferase [Vibrio sp. HB161653]MDP5252605.1 4-alpha-glucanotransferase [Vibrio sp. HB161653]
MEPAEKISEEVIVELAKRANLSQRYINAWGQETDIDSQVQLNLLACLGYDTRSEDALRLSAEKINKPDIIAPLTVIKQGEAVEIALNLGVTVRPSDFQWQLKSSKGECFEGYLQAAVVRDERKQGGALFIHLPVELECGYHQLTVIRKRRRHPYQVQVAIVPQQCYQAPALAAGEKLWGPSVQLYSLRSEHNWGIGDFGDLKLLVSEMAQRGADFIGLNPIHALFPANPEAVSPYSPSSRRWLNTLYIDVTSVAEFSHCETAQERVGSTEFQHKIEQARQSDWVDYRLVSELKLEVLFLLYQDFVQRHLLTHSQRGQDFVEFVEQGGASLTHQATFDAIHCQQQNDDKTVWGWPVFDEAFRHFHAKGSQAFVLDNKEKVDFFKYLQWVAAQQLDEAQGLANALGMKIGLYRDLAVGVADSGSETWADEGQLVLSASIGAPPDVLGPKGQNWGLPPWDPRQLQQNGYQSFIALLRENMKDCGALRIDHILGLLRLWWIPRTGGADQGGYVNNPVEDLLGLLALESHLAKCSVIGEALGTVPEEIKQQLLDTGIYAFIVYFFEQSKHDGGIVSPEHHQPKSIATLCTHDMPTLTGYWHCHDLKMGQEFGLYDDPDILKRLYDERLADKQSILNSLHWYQRLPSHIGHDARYVPMDDTLALALHQHLALGSSSLMAVQLEDWLGMELPVNIPGTVEEYPNWRRKLSVTIEDLFNHQQVERLAVTIDQARKLN